MGYENIATILILFFTGFSFFLMLYDRFRPRVEVHFPEHRTRIEYNSNTSETVRFIFRNKGNIFKFKRPPANITNIDIFFPINFGITEIRRDNHIRTDSHETFNSGRFRNMRYVTLIPFFQNEPPNILYYNEEVTCEVVIQTPTRAGEYEILIPINSREGDLGVKKLRINII